MRRTRRRRDSGCVHFEERVYSLRAFPDRKYCRARALFQRKVRLIMNFGSINWKWHTICAAVWFGYGNPANNTYRLVHGEGDNLPGLIIDVYDHTAVIQAHSAWNACLPYGDSRCLVRGDGDVVEHLL